MPWQPMEDWLVENKISYARSYAAFSIKKRNEALLFTLKWGIEGRCIRSYTEENSNMDNENPKLVPIPMCRSDDWITNTYVLRSMRRWCADRGIQGIEMKISSDDFPHTMLIPSEDAVAFKLKFGRLTP